MAEINIWKCDICKKEFKEDDYGYKNKEDLNININLGLYEGVQNFYYKDTCKSCREDIYTSIFIKIFDIQTK